MQVAVVMVRRKVIPMTTFSPRLLNLNRSSYKYMSTVLNVTLL